jgi:predicted DNA binding CopG/RHH family protein
MKKSKKLRIPKFRNEDEEREFWASHDSADYIDWSEAREVIMPNLKPTLKTISIRLPEIMLEELKLIANKRDVPYQSLMKIFLAERVKQELHSIPK